MFVLFVLINFKSNFPKLICIFHSFKCLFELAEWKLIDDRPNIVIFDKLKHFLKILCTAHRGSE